jgi:AraC-like DNA-binding protein
MLLEKILSNLAIHVEPFALCVVSEGWRLRLPGPPRTMIHFVLKGSGVLHDSRGKASALSPNCLGVVPCGVTHALECGGKIKSEVMIDAPPQGPPIHRIVAGSSEKDDLIVACGLVNVRYGQVLDLFDHLREVLLVDVSAMPEVATAFQRILSEQINPGLASRTLTGMLMGECLVHLFRRLATEREDSLPWLMTLQNQQLAKAIDRMLENPAAKHTVESLAEAAAMSRAAFAKHFTAAFGRSPMSLMHEIRMQYACHLLRETRISIKEVVNRVGFSSRTHFSRAFKGHCGVSPTAYRTQ